jgi:hypothetical protein
MVYEVRLVNVESTIFLIGKKCPDAERDSRIDSSSDDRWLKPPAVPKNLPIPVYWKTVHQRCLQEAVEGCDAEALTQADGTCPWLR